MRQENLEEESPLIYGLEHQARALASASTEANDSNVVRFVVGTQSLKTENQIHLLEYLEESHSLSKAIFKFPDGEVWNISTSPKHGQYVMTCHARQSDQHVGQVENLCSLWKFPIDLSAPLIDEDNVSSLSLEKVCDFDKDNGEQIDIGRNALWKPEEGSEIVNYSGNKIYLWDVEYHKLISSFTVEDRSTRGASKFTKITSIRWSPHSNCSTLGVAIGSNIFGKDLRVKSDASSNHAWTISSHNNLVRDLDFNPNAQYYLATCGDDSTSRFWDIRKPEAPCVTLLNHSHWIWSVRYNQFHDQLVLTCSSDSRVVLNRVTSLASQPFGHLLDDEDEPESDEELGGHEKDSLSNGISSSSGPRMMNDEVVATFEEHEDSVYAAEWSTADPWIFASLSYDGRLVINKVPKSEKFSILF
ncbi:WD repeat-containing protein DWA2 [Halotydeus destructor]|nr:WD repeat-containing protein DWA2 [Halotydeus destructor]